MNNRKLKENCLLDNNIQAYKLKIIILDKELSLIRNLARPLKKKNKLNKQVIYYTLHHINQLK
jgi:hypothetical protein